jgi:hypothetical protein
MPLGVIALSFNCRTSRLPAQRNRIRRETSIADWR